MFDLEEWLIARPQGQKKFTLWRCITPVAASFAILTSNVRGNFFFFFINSS